MENAHVVYIYPLHKIDPIHSITAIVSVLVNGMIKVLCIYDSARIKDK